VALVLGVVAPAHASLFRYGNISWCRRRHRGCLYGQTAWFLDQASASTPARW
jgi:hypothetical protein